MAYLTFQQYNQTGIAGLLTYPSEVVPQFVPLVLIALFSIVLLSTYFGQKRIVGRGDLISSFAVAGFFTAVISITMTMVDGLINLATVITAIGVAVIGIILLFVTDKD